MQNKTDSSQISEVPVTTSYIFFNNNRGTEDDIVSVKEWLEIKFIDYNLKFKNCNAAIYIEAAVPIPRNFYHQSMSELHALTRYTSDAPNT